MLLRKRRYLPAESSLARHCALCACSSTRCDAVGRWLEQAAPAAGSAVPGAPPRQRRSARFRVEFAVLDTRLNSEQRRWICEFRKAQAGLEPMIHALCSNVV